MHTLCCRHCRKILSLPSSATRITTELCACCRYNHNCFFARLIEQKSRLRSLLLGFFQTECAASRGARRR